MADKYEIDNLDRQILTELQRDARQPFLEIARKLVVSGGTIHQRYDKLKEAGIVKGSQINVDYSKLGQGVSVLLGIHLGNAKSATAVIKKLEKIPEITEVFYTTGKYALIIKILTHDIDGYHDFLVNKLQTIEEIQATESFICLSTPVKRELSAKQWT